MRKVLCHPSQVVVLMALASACLWARERQVVRNELPVAVRETADKQAQGATVRGYAKDVENGQVEYEVQLAMNGHSKDVTIAPDGRVLEIEEEVRAESLPAVVASRLSAKAGKGKIEKVESLTKRGVIVAYEAQVLTARKRSEIQVGPDGDNLSHPE